MHDTISWVLGCRKPVKPSFGPDKWVNKVTWLKSHDRILICIHAFSKVSVVEKHSMGVLPWPLFVGVSFVSVRQQTEHFFERWSCGSQCVSESVDEAIVRVWMVIVMLEVLEGLLQCQASQLCDCRLFSRYVLVWLCLWFCLVCCSVKLCFMASNVDVGAHGSGCMLHVVECVYQLAVVATHNAVHP